MMSLPLLSLLLYKNTVWRLRTHVVSMRMWVWSLASLSGLRIWHDASCSVCHRCGLDLALQWLCCRPAAAAPIWPLAWELPCAAGVFLKWKQTNKQKIPLCTVVPVFVCFLLGWYKCQGIRNTTFFLQPSCFRLVVIWCREFPSCLIGPYLAFELLLFLWNQCSTLNSFHTEYLGSFLFS